MLGDIPLRSNRIDGGWGKAGLGVAAALMALTSCAKPQAVVYAPAPVGHTYQTVVQVPPPVLRRVKITPVQYEQAQQAFNVIALKSALMVGALSCNQQDRYDTFMLRFQPHILAEQHVMDAYFRRTVGGARGQTQEDAFVTQLANNQSVTGISQGSIFCLNNSAEFNAVLALQSPAALDAFVTDQAPGSLATVASR